MSGSIKVLARDIRETGHEVPREGDVALLEWPTSNSAAEFRLSFLDRHSQLFDQAQNIFSPSAECRRNGWRRCVLVAAGFKPCLDRIVI